MIRKVRGTRDILPPESRLWGAVEAEARRSGVTDLYHIFALSGADTAGVPLGTLSAPLVDDLAFFSKVSPEQLPDTLGGFSVMGCTTAIWSRNDKSPKKNEIGLAPILTGFVRINL